MRAAVSPGPEGWSGHVRYWAFTPPGTSFKFLHRVNLKEVGSQGVDLYIQYIFLQYFNYFYRYLLLILNARASTHMYMGPLERLKEVKEVKNLHRNNILHLNFLQLKKPTA